MKTAQTTTQPLYITKCPKCRRSVIFSVSKLIENKHFLYCSKNHKFKPKSAKSYSLADLIMKKAVWETQWKRMPERIKKQVVKKYKNRMVQTREGGEIVKPEFFIEINKILRENIIGKKYKYIAKDFIDFVKWPKYYILWHIPIILRLINAEHIDLYRASFNGEIGPNGIINIDINKYLILHSGYTPKEVINKLYRNLASALMHELRHALDTGAPFFQDTEEYILPTKNRYQEYLNQTIERHAVTEEMETLLLGGYDFDTILDIIFQRRLFDFDYPPEGEMDIKKEYVDSIYNPIFDKYFNSLLNYINEGFTFDYAFNKLLINKDGWFAEQLYRKLTNKYPTTNKNI